MKSISTCFVLSWYTGFAVMHKAALLSQQKKAGWWLNPKVLSEATSQTISPVTVAIVLYLDLANDLETIYCFLHF